MANEGRRGRQSEAKLAVNVETRVAEHTDPTWAFFFFFCKCGIGMFAITGAVCARSGRRKGEKKLSTWHPCTRGEKAAVTSWFRDSSFPLFCSLHYSSSGGRRAHLPDRSAVQRAVRRSLIPDHTFQHAIIPLNVSNNCQKTTSPAFP